MTVDRPRLLVLDTSQLSSLIRDAYSPDRMARQRAVTFEGRLADAGILMLIFSHHIDELLQHQNDGTAARRMDYIRSRKLMAWIARCDHQPGTGSIACMLAAEIAAAERLGPSPATAVRDEARARLICYGTGEQALAAHDPMWPTLRRLLQRDQPRARAAIAVTRANVPDQSAMTLAEIASAPIRSKEQRLEYLAQLNAFLAGDIKVNADKRIPDPANVAARFVDRVEADSSEVDENSTSPLLGYLRKRGITEDDLGPDATFGDARRLLEFRGKAKVAAEAAGIPVPHYTVADLDRFPAWIIDNGLIRFGQKRATNSGGDQNDRYFACLAAYADRTFVDKRTHADAMQACRSSQVFKSIVSRIDRVGGYEAIMSC